MNMYDNATNIWQADPPDYECIMDGWWGGVQQRPGCGGANDDDHRSNLDQYLSMEGSLGGTPVTSL